MSTPMIVLSWVIGVANPVSALLVGPALATWLRNRQHSRLVEVCQGGGWAILGIAQAAFFWFGVVSQLDGFRFAQPMMIVIAALNFVVWRKAMRKPKPAPVDPSAERLAQAIVVSPHFNAAIQAALASVQRDPATAKA